MTFQIRMWSPLLAVSIACAGAIAHAEDRLDEAPAASFVYQFIPASAFVSRDTRDLYRYVGAGCVEASPGTTLVHKLQLPQGVTLQILRLYYRDETPATLMATFTHYDAAGSVTDLGLFRSRTTPGNTSQAGENVNHVIDNAAQAYVVNVQFKSAASDADYVFADGFEPAPPPVFCGVRIAYTP